MNGLAKRRVLEGVPKVNFYRGEPKGPEDDPLPSCVAAILQFLGDDLGIPKPELRNFPEGSQFPFHEVHYHLMGLSGEAFRHVWGRESFDNANGSIHRTVDDPLAPVRWVFDGIGYEHEIIVLPAAQKEFALEPTGLDAKAVRQKLVASIDAGHPVLCAGLIGPPEHGIIAGYDDDGDTAIGWSFFQEDEEFKKGLELEPNGMFRRRGWFEEALYLVLIGKKGPLPSRRSVSIEALARGLEILRNPKVKGESAGIAAYTDWSQTLLKDSLFEGVDEETLKQRFFYHWALAGELAESRAYGSVFLHFAADCVPEAHVPLLRAAECFDHIHDLVWAVWEFTNDRGADEKDFKRFQKGSIRQRLVPLVRNMRKQDVEAIEHIEEALRIAGVTTNRPDVVLSDVPRVGFDIRTNPICGCFEAALKYIGLQPDYHALMAISGASFRRYWNRDDGGNVDLGYLGVDPIRRIGTAMNISLWDAPKDRQAILDAFRESLSRGRPVIGFGIVGPPEACLVTGLKDQGEVVVGWSYFQEPKDSPFVQPDWFSGSEMNGPAGCIILGDLNRWPGPSQKDVLRSTLLWAVDLLKRPSRPEKPDHVTGIAAAEEFAKALLVDGDYQTDDPQVLETRGMILCDQATMVWERESASIYFRSIADSVPQAKEHLLEAAKIFERVSKMAEKLYTWNHADFVAIGRDLRSRLKREELSMVMSDVARFEKEALRQMEEALPHV